MNTAIAALLDVPYSEKDLLRKKRYHMEEAIRDRYAAESRAIADEAAKKEAVKVTEEQKQERIVEAIGGLDAVAFGRLPEFDRHGDYSDFWERIAAVASGLADCEISTAAVQEVVRRGRRE